MKKINRGRTCHLRELWHQGIVELLVRNHDMSELNETWDKYKCSTRHDQSGHVDHFENNKIIEVAESYEEDKEGDDVLVCVTGQWSRLELKSKTKNLFSVMQSQGVKNLTIAFLLYVANLDSGDSKFCWTHKCGKHCVSFC